MTSMDAVRAVAEPRRREILRLIWDAVDMLVVSFPNPVFHGSHVNQYHVNDWPLDAPGLAASVTRSSKCAGVSSGLSVSTY